MPLLPGIGRAIRSVPIGIEMPRRVKMLDILTIDLRVAIHVPHIWKTNRALRDEHPFVPVILGASMWSTERSDWSPTQDFFHHGTNVWQGWIVGEVRKACAAHDCVEFGMCARLCLWVCNHCERPPSHHCCNSLRTADTTQWDGAETVNQHANGLTITLTTWFLKATNVLSTIACFSPPHESTLRLNIRDHLRLPMRDKQLV